LAPAPAIIAYALSLLEGMGALDDGINLAVISV
jgi:hypothetical protein